MFEVVQFSQVFRVEDLILVVLNPFLSFFIGNFLNLCEEIIVLLLLNCELPVLDVKLENSPRFLWAKLWQKLVLSDFGYVWNITQISSEQFEAQRNLFLDILKLSCKVGFFRLL